MPVCFALARKRWMDTRQSPASTIRSKSTVKSSNGSAHRPFPDHSLMALICLLIMVGQKRVLVDNLGIEVSCDRLAGTAIDQWAPVGGASHAAAQIRRFSTFSCDTNPQYLGMNRDAPGTKRHRCLNRR